MATYRTADLLKRVHELVNDDIKYVDIYESEGDEELAPFLSFEGIVTEDSEYGIGGIGFEEIDSVEDIDDDNTNNCINPDDPCAFFSFTYNEISTFARALDDALEFYKIRSSSKDCCREEKDDIKKQSVSMRNLQAKLFKKIKRSYE